MNNQRRKRLKDAIKLLEQARSIIDSVRDEEEESYDNLPEGLQDSEKGGTMLDNMDVLEEQGESIGEIISELEEV